MGRALQHAAEQQEQQQDQQEQEQHQLSIMQHVQKGWSTELLLVIYLRNSVVRSKHGSSYS